MSGRRLPSMDIHEIVRLCRAGRSVKRRLIVSLDRRPKFHTSVGSGGAEPAALCVKLG